MGRDNPPGAELHRKLPGAYCMVMTTGRSSDSQGAAPTKAASAPPAGLHRIIRLHAIDGEVRGALEDDFHHFRVLIRHDGARVTNVEATALRQPFSLCGAAGGRLDELVGQRLLRDTTQFFRIHDALLQCTHQFDLATLAIALAARGGSARHYHAFVEDGAAVEQRRATLRRDGETVLRWAFQDGIIEAPDPYCGHMLGRGFTAWAGTSLDTDDAEAALVLRRAIFISGGRGRTEELDRQPHAVARGGCWVQQPERASLATREKGTSRDHSDRPHQLTAGDDGWLAFEDAEDFGSSPTATLDSDDPSQI